MSKAAIRRIAAGLAACAWLIYWLGACTDVDLRLADAMFDARLGLFPWRDAWLADTFNHRILKAILTVAAASGVTAALADAIWPRAHLAAVHRLRLRIVALSAALVPLATSLLKAHSIAHCPWDLARYGGAEPYVRIFEALPLGTVAGHCLPAGHASSALWLVSLVVCWLPGAPRRALLAAALALAGGFAVGWMQQLRGAHFLTHTLWSMWIACAIVFALVLLGQRSGKRQADAILDGVPG
ncbi:phosphatase PAP2 family protein [Massilia sp. ST3]|uniref:phosphatase PAP2 family protein n=1 Tax=Massilia sp. ST3 TaxID=2824903 RepID=UPI001E4407A3|nr:phosphatase PAP2 family protein [Massilia sp. ST3]